MSSAVDHIWAEKPYEIHKEKPATKKRKKASARSNERKRAGFLAEVETVTDGQAHEYVRRGNNKGIGDLRPALNSIDAIEWLSPFYEVERSKDAVIIRKNQILRDLIDDWRAAKNLPAETGVGTFARRLYEGIKTREEEFRDQRKDTKWATYQQIGTLLEKTLAWVKEELKNALKD